MLTEQNFQRKMNIKKEKVPLFSRSMKKIMISPASENPF